MAVYCSGGIGMHLPAERTFSDEIPDRILFICMDLGSGAADSADCMGCCRIFMRIMEKRTLTNLMATVILLGIVFLSGNPVSEWTKEQTAQIPVMDMTIQQNPETSPWETLSDLTEYRLTESGDASVTLWAPKEIMAAARAYSAEIYPVYGRSIWDASLGSYSYDTYATGQEDLYLWMNHLEATGETEYVRMDESTGARTIDFTDCLKYAAEKNVDIVLLPGNLRKETLSELQNTAGSKLQPLNGYYLLTMQK